jgi:hypothetical protein
MDEGTFTFVTMRNIVLQYQRANHNVISRPAVVKAL